MTVDHVVARETQTAPSSLTFHDATRQPEHPQELNIEHIRTKLSCKRSPVPPAREFLLQVLTAKHFLHADGDEFLACWSLDRALEQLQAFKTTTTQTDADIQLKSYYRGIVRQNLTVRENASLEYLRHIKTNHPQCE